MTSARPPLPIRVVLVRPHRAENVGAAARALKNFGLSDWAWVNPQLGGDMEPAYRLAVDAGDLLETVRVCQSLDEAIADCVWVVGTSSRHVAGQLRIDPHEAARRLVERAAAGPVALVFGDERNGLSNSEVLSCDALSAAPTLEDQPSINLAQAVVLYSYEVRMAQLRTTARALAPRPVPATRAELQTLETELRAVLQASHFLTHSERHAVRDLMASLQHDGLSRKEVQLWLAALHSLDRSASS
jgi:tRNA/rRNA methyltransferase/tRNA (cytidine32/uridine32-2'-O)-methyltransferase